MGMESRKREISCVIETSALKNMASVYFAGSTYVYGIFLYYWYISRLMKSLEKIKIKLDL